MEWFNKNWFASGEKLNRDIITKKIKEEFAKVAVDYYAFCGAKYGKIQTLEDFIFPPGQGGIPYRMRDADGKPINSAKFKTIEATVEADQYEVQISLWIQLFNKNGSLSANQIRLTSLKLYQ